MRQFGLGCGRLGADARDRQQEPRCDRRGCPTPWDAGPARYETGRSEQVVREDLQLRRRQTYSSNISPSASPDVCGVGMRPRNSLRRRKLDPGDRSAAPGGAVAPGLLGQRRARTGLLLHSAKPSGTRPCRRKTRCRARRAAASLRHHDRERRRLLLFLLKARAPPPPH